jgi:hypothetical protein
MQVERVPSGISGARVRNTWITNPLVRDNAGKLALIPGVSAESSDSVEKGSQGSPGDGSASHQLVGEVMAHQGEDG